MYLWGPILGPSHLDARLLRQYPEKQQEGVGVKPVRRGRNPAPDDLEQHPRVLGTPAQSVQDNISSLIALTAAISVTPSP